MTFGLIVGPGYDWEEIMSHPGLGLRLVERGWDRLRSTDGRHGLGEGSLVRGFPSEKCLC